MSTHTATCKFNVINAVYYNVFVGLTKKSRLNLNEMFVNPFLNQFVWEILRYM